jgi:hypothetical protein
MRRDAVKFMISTLEVIPVIALTPEVAKEEQYKIDKAISILKLVGVDAEESVIKRANSYIVFLSAVMIINNARSILDINGEYDKLLCSLDEEKILLFLSQTAKYFETLESSTKKLAEIDPQSSFKKIADSSTKLSGLEKSFREASFKAVMALIEVEKKRICD